MRPRIVAHRLILWRCAAAIISLRKRTLSSVASLFVEYAREIARSLARRK